MRGTFSALTVDKLCTMLELGLPLIRLDSMEPASAMRICSLSDDACNVTTWPLPLDRRAFVNTNDRRFKSIVVQFCFNVSLLINNYSHRNAAQAAAATTHLYEMQFQRRFYVGALHRGTNTQVGAGGLAPGMCWGTEPQVLVGAGAQISR